MSRPSRARGLKQAALGAQVIKVGVSRPSRARGLKRYTDFCQRVIDIAVAPFTGAWIETIRQKAIAPQKARRALHGRVD